VRRGAGVAVLALALVSSGCGWRGLNSVPLPGVQGVGPGSFTIQAQMPDVDNVERNSRVRVGDVNVGTVTEIERQGWNALVTITLNGDVVLPANATAKIGQTSLLGSQHIELAAPADKPPEGRLKEGSLIPLASSGAFSTTEQALAAVALLLNGGGLGNIQDITEALSVAGGNHGQISRWSVPAVLSRGTGVDVDAIRLLAVVAFAIAVAWLLVAVARGFDWVRAAAWATLGVLVASAYIVPWYLIWLLPVAAISRDRVLIGCRSPCFTAFPLDLAPAGTP